MSSETLDLIYTLLSMAFPSMWEPKNTRRIRSVRRTARGFVVDYR